MKKLLSALLLLLLATACASTVVPPPKTAEHYLEEGEANFEKGRYEDAIANWEKVRDSYFSPELNILSELKIAEAYFLSERYVEAATAYEDFLKQHPDHPRTADVLFQLGLSYFHQMLAPDRDQTATRNALSTFNDLQKRFPDFSRAEELATKIAQCRQRLAEHEVLVGQFYLRTKQYQAASNRISGVLAENPDYPKKDEAYFLLGHAYLMLEQRQRAADAFNSLFREYPASDYVLQAQKLVEKNY